MVDVFTSANDVMFFLEMFVLCPVKAKFHCAIQVADLVADLRVRVVCVSQAGRKLVESQLRTGLRPGSSYLYVSR